MNASANHAKPVGECTIKELREIEARRCSVKCEPQCYSNKVMCGCCDCGREADFVYRARAIDEISRRQEAAEPIVLKALEHYENIELRGGIKLATQALAALNGKEVA